MNKNENNQQLKINQEFKNLLPPLSQQEKEKLKNLLLNEGCRDAIVTWNGEIIDGHNRYEICIENNIPFKTIEMNFKNKLEAKKWIIRNQLGRRNSTDYQKIILVSELTEELKEQGKQNQIEGGKGLSKLTKVNTRETIAELANASTGSVHKVQKIKELATDEQKEKLNSGDLSINAVYNSLPKKPKEIIKATKVAPFKSDSKMIHNENCLDTLKRMADNSIDSVVTDPPYGISFMNKKWDYEIPTVEIWKECFRVLKPGGHLLAFASTRTQHRMAVNIEDSGFEIRDMISWVYGSGFPKSHDVGKALDAMQGKEREVIGTKKSRIANKDEKGRHTIGASKTVDVDITVPATEEVKQWEGWGSALKPAHEPITVARKPLSEDSIAENVLKYSTGGLNIDECRIEHNEDLSTKGNGKKLDTNNQGWGFRKVAQGNEGRWPANLIQDGSEEVVALFPNSSERFFYCPKTSSTDRNEGLDKFEEKVMDESRKEGNVGGDNPRNRGIKKTKNNHPTVKPTRLMQWLVRLVTPKGGTVYDPFMGSGSTGKACMYEGFEFIGSELDADYCRIAEARMLHVNNKWCVGYYKLRGRTAGKVKSTYRLDKSIWNYRHTYTFSKVRFNLSEKVA